MKQTHKGTHRLCSQLVWKACDTFNGDDRQILKLFISIQSFCLSLSLFLLDLDLVRINECVGVKVVWEVGATCSSKEIKDKSGNLMTE